MKLLPQIVEIPFKDEQHKLVVEAVRQRRKMSYDRMSLRYNAWADMEERFMAYIKPTDGDSKRSNLRKEGKPQFTTVEIPYSYAVLLTLHTYLTSTFLGRNPVLQYEARHGEGQDKVMAVEAVMDHQLVTGQMLVPLYLWLMDAPKYGLGVLASHWCEESVVTTEAGEEDVTYFGIPTGRKHMVKRTMRIPGYKGNKVFNVRPQDWFPDPRVSTARFQEGEFAGRRVEVGWNTILKRQAEGRYYNVDVLKNKLKVKFDEHRDRGSSQLVLPDGMDTFYIPAQGGSDAQPREIKNFVELFELQIELVPKEWKFGTSTTPEKWVITVANGEVIVSIEPLGLYHDKFTFDVLEHEVEAYALSKRSMLEVLDPLNNTLTWLFNSHMHNVRKVLNDQLIVDPSGVVMKDLTDPGAGRLVRLKPEAYGKDVRMYVHQLQVQDVTQNHLRDAMLVAEMMQRISGVVENVMGMQGGGRKTATEVRTTSAFSMNRLKTVAEYASAMGFAPWAQKLLQTTQQKYTGEQMFRIAGDLMRTKSPMRVRPEDIAGAYDFVPVDGTMPVDRYAQAMLWKEMLSVFMSSKQPMPGIDMMGILKHIAYLSGVKNFSQFEVKVMPDAQVMGNLAAGNVVPLGGPGGQPRAGNPGAVNAALSGATPQIPQSGSVGGVGRPA